MSWFDTNKIASMATKAMKEAQKTLDTALDIKEEEGGDSSVLAEDSMWASWKMPKSESDSKLSEKPMSSSSLWGSFSGSFIDSGSIGGGLNTSASGVVTNNDVVTTAPVSVAAGHSSVLGGEEDRDIEVQLEPFNESDTFER